MKEKQSRKNIEKEFHKKIDVNDNIVKKFLYWTMHHFFITFIVLYILSIVSLFYGNSGASILFGIMLLVYTIIYLSNNIRKNVHKFLHHELELRQILIGYMVSVLSIILLFAITYWAMTTLGIGYIKYGSCTHTGDVSSTIIANDAGAIKHIGDYAYFSAVTFFTVGYGDICPMGVNKFISILNAMIGNMFTVVVLSIAITNYTNKDDDEET